MALLFLMPYLLFMLWLKAIEFPLVTTWLLRSRRPRGIALLTVTGSHRLRPSQLLASGLVIVAGTGATLLLLEATPLLTDIWIAVSITAGLAVLIWEGRSNLRHLGAHFRYTRRFKASHPDHLEVVTVAAWPPGLGLGHSLIVWATSRCRHPIIARANNAGLAALYERNGATTDVDGLTVLWNQAEAT